MVKKAFVTAALIVSVLTLLLQINSSGDLQAAENSTGDKNRAPEFVSNQILIRLSEDTASVIRTNIQKDQAGRLDFKKADVVSGVEGLDQFVRANGAVEMRPAFSKGADKAKSEAGEKSKAKLKRWYVLTLDKEEKKVNSASEEFKTLKAQADSIRKIKGVEAVELNGILETAYTPNDTYYSNQYAPAKIKADLAWDLTEGTSSAVVAVLDTGILAAHEDLSGKVIAAENFTPSVNGTNDVNGHGTHVAGIVAANSNNSLGVAGISSKVSLLNAKVLRDDGAGEMDDVSNGIEWSADNGANVINMSFAGNYDECNSLIEDSLDYAWSEGVLLVAAGGNGAANDIYMPALCDHVISVVNTNSSDAKSSTSNYHASMTLAAPGDNLYSTYNNTGGFGYYKYSSGTSMASPVVAGVAALVKSANSYLNNQEMYDILTSTADPISGTGTNWQYGRVDAQKALAPSTRNHYTTTYCLSGPDPRIHLRWTSVPNAVGYSVYRTPAGGSESYFGATSGIAINDDTVYSGQQYSYRVVAQFADSSTLSGVGHSITSVTCGYPNLNSSTSAYCVGGGTTSRIHLQWDAVADASYYNIYRTPAGGSESYFGATSGIAVNDETVYPGQQYNYRIVAVFPDSTTLAGVPETLTADVCVEPNFNSSTSAYCVGGGATSRIHLQWDAVPHTSMYKLYRTVSGSESLFGVTSGVAVNDDTVTGAQNYSYRVEAWFPDNSILNGDPGSYTAVSCP